MGQQTRIANKHGNLNAPLNYSISAFIAAVLISCLATTALLTNFLFFKFPGNNYFPANTSYAAASLIISYLGVYLCFNNHNLVKIIKEIIYFFLVMSVLAFFTNAVQYTPFQPIDQHIINFENKLGIDIKQIVAWTVDHQQFAQLMAFIYDSLPYQMEILPLLIIFCQQWACIRSYYCLLLLSALLGFTFYYFFPTVAPASIIDSPHFTAYQLATGIKFRDLHSYIPPSTLEGGLIALPSFHTIWAWACLYLARGCRWLLIILAPINCLLITSCVLLGWHYPTDLFGSLLILIICHLYLAKISNRDPLIFC